MTDLHTHILPRMDDGAVDVQTSLAMLRAEYEQGVDTVALTSHFYGDKETVSEFLARRTAAMQELKRAIDALPEGEKSEIPRLLLGAEVTWMPQFLRWDRPERLAYEGSDCILLELPFAPWGVQVFRGLYDIMNMTGLTPVIAHVDRYWGYVSKSEMGELFSMGLPVQISADAFLHFSTRGRAMRLLEEQKVQMLISDAHDLEERAVNMGEACAFIERKNAGLFGELAYFTLLAENG